MPMPAAREGDQVVATDIHIVMIPSPGGPVPTPLPHPFVGKLDDGLSDDVTIEGKKVALKGSTATNSPSHVPQGGSFQTPPEDSGTVQMGSATVFVNGKAVARLGDMVTTCADIPGAPGTIVSGAATVMVGG